MSTISDYTEKSKNSSISHSEFKIQNIYNNLTKELYSKFEKEGFNDNNKPELITKNDKEYVFSKKYLFNQSQLIHQAKIF